MHQLTVDAMRYQYYVNLIFKMKNYQIFCFRTDLKHQKKDTSLNFEILFRQSAEKQKDHSIPIDLADEALDKMNKMQLPSAS